MNNYVHGHSNIDTPPMAEMSGDLIINTSYGKHLTESDMFYGDSRKSPTSEENYSYVTTEIDPKPHIDSVNVAYQQPFIITENCSNPPTNLPSFPKPQNPADNQVYQDPSITTGNHSFAISNDQGSSDSDNLMDNLAYQQSPLPSIDDHQYTYIASDFAPTSIHTHLQDPQYEPVEVTVNNKDSN